MAKRYQIVFQRTWRDNHKSLVTTYYGVPTSAYCHPQQRAVGYIIAEFDKHEHAERARDLLNGEGLWS